MRRHRGRGRALSAAGLILALSTPATAEPDIARVRPLGARVAALLEWGIVASPTMAMLVEALQSTDVIVHIEKHRDAFRPAPGETRFVARAGGSRYLRIGIAPDLTGNAAIALLGHELYHAWEIAQARWADSPAAVEALYAQIGHIHRRDGAVHADSAEAQRTGRQVHDELTAFGSGD